MKRITRHGKPGKQAPLVRDIDPPIELSRAMNDADDRSDEGCPTSDHEAEGWRATPPVKP